MFGRGVVGVPKNEKDDYMKLQLLRIRNASSSEGRDHLHKQL